MIDKKKLYEEIKEAGGCDAKDEYSRGWDEAIAYVLAIVEKQPEAGWIPFKLRETDEEEKEAYGVNYMLDGELPEDDQEILVTYKSGYVGTDTFISNGVEVYLDSNKDLGTEAIAWMSKPEPYKEG